MTECITEQLIFSFFRKRQLTVDFEGGEITSDAGLLLIRQADNSLHLTKRIAECITDRRDSRSGDIDSLPKLMNNLCWSPQGDAVKFPHVSSKKKKHQTPLLWVVDSIMEEPSYIDRAWFGCRAIYLYDRLMLVLCSGEEPWGYNHQSPLDRMLAKGIKIQTCFVDTIERQAEILREKGCACDVVKYK